MTEIKPALTPEEWAEYTAPDRCYDFSTWREDGTDAPLTRHVTAALALHGQPFGFTWEDVDAMEAVYRRVISDMRPGLPSDAIERVYDLAARIAALLPPRS